MARVHAARVARRAALAVCLALALPAVARAQQVDPRGLMVGLSGVGYESRTDSTGTSTGAGVGITVGFGIIRQLAIHFRADVGFARDSRTRTIGHAELGGRLAPVRIRRAMPYVEGSFASRGIELHPDAPMTTLGASYGAGMEWWVGRGRSLDVAVVRWSGGRERRTWAGRQVGPLMVTHPRTLRLVAGYRMRAVDRR